jgi:small multidrug resistance pump
MADAGFDDELSAYRWWFYAAALYNLLWGTLNALFPNLYFDLIGMPRPNYPALWQVVGMFVAVFAPVYWWMGRHPGRFRHFIIIAILGKTLGPLGFVFSLFSGQLPPAFAWTLLTNDLLSRRDAGTGVVAGFLAVPAGRHTALWRHQAVVTRGIMVTPARPA